MHGSLALSLWVTVEAYVHRMLGSYANTVDKFIVPSHFYIEKFREWGWDEDRFVYIPNFVDSEAIRPEYHPGERFVFFGRLSPEKGVSTFIKAVAKAGVRAQIIGTGPEESNLRDLAKSERADVDFCGFRTGDNLFGLLRAARAIVLPSEWYENAPISVLEAFAAGKPVIGADIGGIPELVTSERGAIFPAFSVTSLAEQLTCFSEMIDGELVAMGKRAREYVCEVHSRQAYLDRCLRVYRDLIGHE